MRMHHFSIALACALLAACGGDKAAATDGAQGESVLPKPATAGHSVTGMPDPGVANPQMPPAAVQAPDIVELPDEAESDAAPSVDEADDAQQAVSALRAYYAAINARDFAAAHAQWSDGGRASGQSPEQFAAGFAGTDGVSVQIGSPGRIEGAAGSRYIEIPVSLEARQADGSMRRYAGDYALRRSVVDGATPEQQAWHIASADLREVPQ